MVTPDCLAAPNTTKLQCVSFFVNKVADEIVYEEIELLEKTIPQMFGVMQGSRNIRVTMSDVSVLVGSHLIWMVQLLMIAERALGGLVRLEKIEERRRADQGH